MILRPEQIQLMRQGLPTTPANGNWGFRSDNNSSADTATKTNNIDSRQVLDNGAVGASAADGSTVTINALDGGAITAAFGLGNHALDQVTSLASGSLSGAYHTTELALSGALNSVQASKDAYQTAEQNLAAAYDNAKVGSKNMLIALGAGVVLVIVVIAAKRAKK